MNRSEAPRSGADGRVCCVLSMIVAVIVATIGMCGCREQETVPSPVVRPVLSTPAAPIARSESGYSGTIEPRFQADVSFRVLGKIVSRDVNVGDTVKQGQRIATIDPEIQQIAVRSAQASLTNAKALLDNADKNFKRQEKLLAQNAASQSEFDTAKTNYESARSDVTQAESNLAKAKEELDYTELRSDLDGVVMNLYAEREQTVKAGQVVATLADPTVREAVVDVDETTLRGIEPGTEFRIVLQQSDDIQTIGTVREIAPQADAKTRTRRVRISLTDPPEAFRLGSTIRAFPSAASQSDIEVPLSAIGSEDGSSYVWIVDETKNTVHKTAVTVSSTDADHATISDGVRLGDRVVTAGVHSLTEGQTVAWKSKAEP
ncbi:efflux RND transporter periplasmic adaptor subunit [Neorhodopirellula pilleata]|uniref:Multidrug resistance protein MdtA n=1 Tax=Neorhodopirellula pilleata TaxID=2714738 RepID=A0A5C5ZGV3_9BACT|nr:efflux RND transporter periplasmic adaptor subunit [Neorhodopirellula pilleata]TWT86101.1 Multidrug resistance protein MdtA precursor [Neorhodopirellula pilleata]